MFNGCDIDCGSSEQGASEDGSEFDQFPYHDALLAEPPEIYQGVTEMAFC
jgi:hypothetical protein